MRPRTFTQRQFFTCLTLKEFLKPDDRSVMQRLIDTSEHRRYGRHRHAETVIRMIQRRRGETLNARSYHRQYRAMLF